MRTNKTRPYKKTTGVGRISGLVAIKISWPAVYVFSTDE